MNRKIMLIYPPSPVMNREDRCQQPTDDLIVIPPLPPSDLLYLAAIAKNTHCTPIIKDYSGKTAEDFRKDFQKIKPDFILINVASTTLANDLSVLKTVKAASYKVTTIAKGAQFKFLDKETLEEYPEIDIAIRGEAEYTLKDILNGIEYKNILGITYRIGKEIFKNDDRPFIENLDEIPYPARELIDNSVYKRPDTGEPQAIIKVSRGCPYHCFFCLATPVSGEKVRKRSPENILGEIKECYEKYNIKNFIFWSDIFNLDNLWVRNLCQKIIESGMNITFSTNTRADSADPETVKLMKKAGCSLVSIGIESGSQELLDKMGKKITREQIKKTIFLFKKNGIKIYAYYVLGLPWETEETFRETLDFAKYLNTEFVSFYTATALVGTKFYDYVKAHNLGALNYDKPYYFPSVNTHALTKERVFELHKKAVKQYYFRTKYILMMIFKIQKPAELINYFKAGLRLLFRK